MDLDQLNAPCLSLPSHASQHGVQRQDRHTDAASGDFACLLVLCEAVWVKPWFIVWKITVTVVFES